MYKIDEAKVVDIKDNMFIILGKNVFHQETVIPSEAYDSYCFRFSYTCRVKKNEKTERTEDDRIFDALDKIYILTGTASPEFDNIFERITDEVTNTKPGYYNKLKMLFSELVIEIYRCVSKQNDFEIPKKDIRAMQAEICGDYFYSVYMNRISDHSISILANRLFLSERQTNRLIHEIYNMSFSDMINQAVINRSMELLKNTSHSVTEIAELCGFENAGYFCSKFKKAVNLSPSQYRKYIKENKDIPMLTK